MFSPSLWETPLYPGVLFLARFAPLILPPGAPSPRSVLSRRRLLPALECVPLEGCLPPRGFAPSPLERMLPLHLRTGGFIPSPRPDFYYSHPWPIGLTRHCAWRRMERGGVGVGGGFSFTFLLAQFNVLTLSYPFCTQRHPTPGSLQLWVGTIPQLLHIVHLVIALSTGVD